MLADFAASASSFLPHLMFPNNGSLSSGLGNLGANFLDSNSLSNFSATSVNGSGSSEPIYIAISTNPLILLPFCFNSATNSLVPMAGATGTNGVGGVMAGNVTAKGASATAPIIFPNGLPGNSVESQQNHSSSHQNHQQNTSPSSPSGHSNGSNSAASSSSSPSLTNSRSNEQTPTMPFITTFSNLTQHLMNNHNNSQTSQTSSQNKRQTTSALINSLLNAELGNGTVRQRGKVFEYI